MTAPALPPLPLEVERALETLLDRVLEVGRDPMRVVEGAEAYAALVRAIARALGGDDEPVAWGAVDRHGRLIDSREDRASVYATRQEADAVVAAANECWMNEDTNEERDVWAARKPFTVAPLFTCPAAPVLTDRDRRLAECDDDPRLAPAASEVRRVRALWAIEPSADRTKCMDRAIAGAVLRFVDSTHRAEVDAAVAKEREACAARCDKTADDLGRLWELAEDEMARRDLHVRRYQAQRDAAAIRARGEATS